MARTTTKKGLPVGLQWVIAIVFVVGMSALVYNSAQQRQTAIITGEVIAEAEAKGVSVQSLVFNSRNADTYTQEGSDDVELWIFGSNPADPNDIGLLDKVDLSSGTVTSTASQEYKSTDTQNTKDLYFEGTASYYDEKIADWYVSYNEETDKGTLYAFDGVFSNDYEPYILMTDVGTWKDMDTADTLGTSFADSGTDTLNYNVTDGTGTSSVRWSIGNSEAKSELRLPVLCVGDADGDLEGDEITGLTISRFSGKSVANLDDLSDILQMFTESAGTGGDRCIQFGDVIDGSTTGVYEIEIEFAEANCVDEEFEISFDDKIMRNYL